MIKIGQIYFDSKSLQNCFEWCYKIDNSDATASDIKYFENKVISNEIAKGAHLDCDLFGVWSHAFKDKVLANPKYGRFSKQSLDLFIAENQQDVIGFFGKFKQENIFNQAENYHKGFLKAFALMLKIALDLDFVGGKHKIYIMQNHFLAKPKIYERYVKEFLNPCIDALENKGNEELQHLIWNPAQRYSNERQRFLQNPKLKEQLGGAYPLHPFLLERLPSLFFTLLHNNEKQNHLIYGNW